METGTLSELRNKNEVNTTVETPIVNTEEKPPIVDKEPTIIKTTTAEPKPQSPAPANKPNYVGKDCRLCMASNIANISIRFSLVVFVLALSFNLFKTAKANV